MSKKSKLSIKTLMLFASLLVATAPALAQAPSQEEAVKATINALFDGMRKADTALTASAFADDCIMQSITRNKDGVIGTRTENAKKFAASVGGTHPVYDERIQFTKILIDGDLASVWTDYKFYIGDKFSHCGVNSFQLLKTAKGWKIIYLIDTRRKDNCNF